MNKIELIAFWNNILVVHVNTIINVKIHLTKFFEESEVVMQATPEELADWKAYHDEYPYEDLVDEKSREVRGDALIVFMNDALDEEIDVSNMIILKSGSFFWAVHDVFHALSDVSGGNIYISADIEKARIIETIEWFKENKLMIDTDLYELAEEFKHRFRVDAIDIINAAEEEE